MLRSINHKDVEILVIDYSQDEANTMIQTLLEVREKISQENKLVHILTVFGEKNFITKEFIIQAEKVRKQLEPLIIREAIIGLSTIKMWILKAFNLGMSKPLKPFETMQEALNYLTTE